mmetsp:Transcript_13549/g.24508  ORF Transcript_13549/g.24508 Transcript_13549/m.24508 type:complete len:333 (-) Transcript_13549:326-1324(-)
MLYERKQDSEHFLHIHPSAWIITAVDSCALSYLMKISEMNILTQDKSPSLPSTTTNLRIRLPKPNRPILRPRGITLPIRMIPQTPHRSVMPFVTLQLLPRLEVEHVNLQITPQLSPLDGPQRHRPASSSAAGNELLSAGMEGCASLLPKVDWHFVRVDHRSIRQVEKGDVLTGGDGENRSTGRGEGEDFHVAYASGVASYREGLGELFGGVSFIDIPEADGAVFACREDGRVVYPVAFGDRYFLLRRLDKHQRLLLRLRNIKHPQYSLMTPSRQPLTILTPIQCLHHVLMRKAIQRIARDGVPHLHGKITARRSRQQRGGIESTGPHGALVS